MHQDFLASSESMLWTQVLEHHSWNNPSELMDRRSAWEAVGKEHWWFGLRSLAAWAGIVAWHGPGYLTTAFRVVPCPCEDIMKRVRKKHADEGKTAHIQTDDRVWQPYGNWFPATNKTKKSFADLESKWYHAHQAYLTSCLQAVVGPLTNCSKNSFIHFEYIQIFF